MRSPLQPALGELLLQQPHAFPRQLLGITHDQHVIHEDVEVDAETGGLLSQPRDDCFCESTENPRRLEVAEGKTRSPHQTASPRMPNHEPLFAALGNGDVPEPIANVILREVRARLDTRANIPHTRQGERGRWHHTIRAYRVVVAESPLSPALIHDRPWVDCRRGEHFVEPMQRDVLHSACEQRPVRLGDALQQTLLTGPLVEGHLRRRHLLPRLDADATACHNLVELPRKPDVPPLLLPRDRDVGARGLGRGRLFWSPDPVERIHARLSGDVVHLHHLGQHFHPGRPERVSSPQVCVSRLSRVAWNAPSYATDAAKTELLEQDLVVSTGGADSNPRTPAAPQCPHDSTYRRRESTTRREKEAVTPAQTSESNVPVDALHRLNLGHGTMPLLWPCHHVEVTRPREEKLPRLGREDGLLRRRSHPLDVCV